MPDIEFVQPASPPGNKLRWPLSPIDVYAFRWLIQGTWIFGPDLDTELLKQGLSKLLDTYPILCGRVVQGKEIQYRDSGIPFTIESDESLTVDDFGAERWDVQRFGDRRLIKKIKRGLEPLMTVKLTKLRDGWVVAVCCSHACLDGNGFYSMVQNWGCATTGQSFPMPVLDRPEGSVGARRSKEEVVRRAQEAGWHKLSMLGVLRYMTSASHSLDRAFVTFFSPEALRRCKQALVEDSGCRQLSSNTAAIAHVSKCLVRLLGLRPELNFSVSSIIDQRERVAAIPKMFARNAASFVVTEGIPVSASRGVIAGRIHRRLEPMLTKPSAEFETVVELMTEVAQYGLTYSALSIADMFGRRPSLFYTNSFHKFPVYDLEFRGKSSPVRPLRVVPHNLGDAILFWPAPPSVGGFELYFSGTLARAVKALKDTDPWWSELRCFDVP